MMVANAMTNHLRNFFRKFMVLGFPYVTNLNKIRICFLFFWSEGFGLFCRPFSCCLLQSVIASLRGNLPKPGFPLPSGLKRKPSYFLFRFVTSATPLRPSRKTLRSLRLKRKPSYFLLRFVISATPLRT